VKTYAFSRIVPLVGSTSRRFRQQLSTRFLSAKKSDHPYFL
jgi:hypothetical protein